MWFMANRKWLQMQSGFFVFCFLLCFFLSFLGGIIVQDENECAGNSVIVGIPPPAICLFHRRSDLTVHCVEMSVLLVFFSPPSRQMSWTRQFSQSHCSPTSVSWQLAACDGAQPSLRHVTDVTRVGTLNTHWTHGKSDNVDFKNKGKQLEPVQSYQEGNIESAAAL